jgi:hypothetical protein
MVSQGSLMDMQPTLFALPQTAALARFQVWTPVDAAVALWDRFLGDLVPGSRVIEPTCGTGHLFHAMPDGMDVVGIEQDPSVAQVARQVARKRGWQVLVGSFDEVALPWPNAHAIFGNPPWDKPTIDRLLDWSYDHLEQEGRCALLLPAMYTQYACHVAQLAERWAIESVEVPRDVFHPSGLEEPVTFKVFTKTAARRVVGMFLFAETAARRMLSGRYQALLRDHPQTWREVVRTALEALGGAARLKDIYAEVTRLRSGERGIPDRWRNNHVEPKIRQQLQIHPEFQSLGDGRWALAS